MKKQFIFILCLSFFIITNYANPHIDIILNRGFNKNLNNADIEFPKIDRYPEPADFSFMQNRLPESLPSYDPENALVLDVRSCDLTSYYLAERQDMIYWTFDHKTLWPELLPTDFNPENILETEKNPGLNVSLLHQNGITGRDIGIAIIDQNLLIDHSEYSERIQFYEEINIDSNSDASMHGPAVASIAVGKSIGVAPEADLYHISTFLFDAFNTDEDRPLNYNYYAQAIHRILEINEELPDYKKIRVISMSNFFYPGEIGYDEVQDALTDAINQRLLVIYANMDEHYDHNIIGAGRNLYSDPNLASSYYYYEHQHSIQANGDIIIPMDCRSLASPTGTNDYVFYRWGGKSWAIPYLAGIYALTCQVKPDITPETFLNIVFETGDLIEHTDDYSGYDVKKLINPVKIMEIIEIGNNNSEDNVDDISDEISDDTTNDTSNNKDNDFPIDFFIGVAIIASMVGVIFIIYFAIRNKIQAKSMPT